MTKPLWYQMLCTKRYNKRQQAILRETAEIYASRRCASKISHDNQSTVVH